jgi:outer membrane protein assembly factor BamB
MKWHNLTNGIYGTMIAALLCAVLPLAGGAVAQAKEAGPLLLTKCWGIPDEDPATQILASDNGLDVFLAKASGKVESIDILTGKKIWTGDFGGDIASNLVSDDATLFFSSNPINDNASENRASTALRAVSTKTGVAIWAGSLPYSEFTYLGESGDMLIAVHTEGGLEGIRKSDGSIAWRTTQGKKLSGRPHFSPKSLLVADSDGTISLISTSDGSVIAKFKAPTIPVSLFLSEENTLLWGDTKGNITAVDVVSKLEKWKFKTGGSVSGITGEGGAVVVTSYDNFVYMMSQGGRVLWKRRLSGRAAEKPVLINNSLIVTIAGEPGAVFIDLKSGKLLNRVSVERGDHSTASPAILGGDRIVFSDATELYSYSTGNCTSKAEKRDDP